MVGNSELVPMVAQVQAQENPSADYLRTSHSRAWHDLKTRWHGGLPWVLYPSIMIGLVFSLRYSIESTDYTDLDSGPCLPDGRYSIQDSKYNYLASSAFFQVTLGFGAFTFAEAKIIDVVWDVVIGRGGQALLALLSWNVFAEYVMATMQITPITFKTFKTLFVQKDISTVLGITRFIRGFSRRKLPSKTAIAFMVATMAFILAFPTLGSAMTGYSANVDAFVEDQSGSYVPLDNFRRLYYTINDGDRISKSKGYQVTSIQDETFLWRKDGRKDRSRCSFSNATHNEDDECDLLDNVTEYVLKYGAEGAKNSNTTFGGINGSIPAPSLNITVHYIPLYYLSSIRWYPELDGNYSQGIVQIPGGGTLNLVDESRMAWTNGGNTSYNESYLLTNGKCQPTLTYKWGFSYVQLLLIISLLICWDTGLYALYISSHVKMLKNGHDSCSSGEYQAILQLARAVETQIGKAPERVEGTEVALLSEEALKKCIDNDLDGGAMSNKNSLLESSDAGTEAPTWRFHDWIIEEALWLLMLVVSVIGCVIAVWQYPTFILAHTAPLQVVFIMYVGQSWRSRAVLLVWSVLIVLVVTIPVWKGHAYSDE